MKSQLFAFLFLLVVAMSAHAQVLQSEQIELKGEKFTIVWYSTKCFVPKGEGTKIVFYDKGGNPVMDACRTGGGSEPALYTFPDGTVTPARF